VALDSAAARIYPAISSRKSNVLTTMPPRHTDKHNSLLLWTMMLHSNAKKGTFNNSTQYF